MKYISLLVFTAALVWTWNIVHDSSAISFETHSGIQEKMAEYLLENFKAKRPTATDIKVNNLWTEVIGANKLRAHFTLSFKDISESGTITSEIKGDGILERKSDDGSEIDQWSLSTPRIATDSIQFDEATIISKGSSDDPEKSTESVTEPQTTTPEPTGEEHK